MSLLFHIYVDVSCINPEAESDVDNANIKFGLFFFALNINAFYWFNGL